MYSYPHEKFRVLFKKTLFLKSIPHSYKSVLMTNKIKRLVKYT